MNSLQTKFAALMLSTLCLLATASAQVTPSADAYTNTALPTTNNGANVLLYVSGATEVSYIQFNLSSIPASASVSEATLKLYVNSVTTAGTFNVDYITGAWEENTITADLQPALGAAIATSGTLTTASKNQYILIDVTSAVQAWLDGSQANDGLALVANSTFKASFDSKENTTTSHPAELDIVLAGGGTITGVQTPSGSGLTGGGTSGTLNLSLLTSCSSGQVLSWNGSAWVCTSLSGGGSVTSVGSGSGLLGGPITTAGTLSVDPTVVPLLASSNLFTGNQTVNGNLSATGVVTGSGFQIGSNLFAYGSFANSNAFLGFAGNTSMTGGGNTASGQGALAANTSGYGDTAAGVNALPANSTGGDNVAVGLSALYTNTTGSGNTAVGVGSGFPADQSPLTGNFNTFLGIGATASTGTLTNATAIGDNAEVAASNAMVLGSINGVNGATANTLVGIGTTTPAQALDVAGNIHASGNFIGNGSQLTGLPAPTTLNCTGCITNTQLGVNYAASTSQGGAATTANNAFALSGLPASAFATLGTANTFAASQTMNGNLSLSGTGNGISFPDGTKQTSAAVGTVPSGYMILGTTPVAPAGYTLSPISLTAAAGGWAPAASLPQAANHLAAARDTQGNIYAIGGDNGSAVLATVEKYSPSSNTWTAVASLPYKVSDLAAAADTQGNIYAIGGFNFPNILATVEKYSPSSNTWTAVASLPYAAYDLAAAADTQGNIYAIGGRNGGGALATVEKYSPSSNTWTAVASLPYAAYSLAAAADTQGNIYAIGGDNGTVEKYSPSSNTWTAVASLPYAVSDLAAAADTQGNMYAIGGIGSAGTLATVEKYSPSSNTWTALVSLPYAVSDLAAAADTQGNMYAIGGIGSAGTLATVEKLSGGTLYLFTKN